MGSGEKAVIVHKCTKDGSKPKAIGSQNKIKRHKYGGGTYKEGGEDKRHGREIREAE